MAPQRIGILPAEDRLAIFRGAQRLGLDPYEFGAILSMESGPNMDPNIVGGAGGRHRGLIQFGQPEQKTYGISGTQTRAQQIPSVLRYFEDRGYKPGMGTARAYATILGGNPNVSLNAKDAFGTSVNTALNRFKAGGDLNANARRVLGDLPADFSQGTASNSTNGQQISTADFLSQFTNALLNQEAKPVSIKDMLAEQLLKEFLSPPTTGLEMLTGLV